MDVNIYLQFVVRVMMYDSKLASKAVNTPGAGLVEALHACMDLRTYVAEHCRTSRPLQGLMHQLHAVPTSQVHIMVVLLCLQSNASPLSIRPRL